MAVKRHLNEENSFEETGELKDPEIPEMGEEEEILTPKNPEEMEFDDAELVEPTEEE